jgi:arylsulfatase A-like enzyme
MVIVVGDHGEMLGEHLIMGHGLGSYHELIHVPLLIRYPGQEQPQRFQKTVSTAWLFHTILNEVGIQDVELSYAPLVDTKSQSLRYVGRADQPPPVLSESFAPDNLLMTMERLTPDLVAHFNSRATNRSFIVDPYKILQIDGLRSQLFHLEEDRSEMENLADKDPLFSELDQAQKAFMEKIVARRPEGLQASAVELSGDQISQRLRGLGYLD